MESLPSEIFEGRIELKIESLQSRMCVERETEIIDSLEDIFL
jgi:hypothetical protein